MSSEQHSVRNGRFVLRVETLEDRTVPAGNVRAFIGDGILYVSGDNLGNQISIIGAGTNNLMIRSLDGTTRINGQLTPVFVEGARRGYHIDLFGGDDVVFISGTRSDGTLTVNTGNGNDRVILDDMGHRKETVVNTGGGNDTILLNGSGFRSAVFINTGAGNDLVTANQIGVRDLFMLDPAGSDVFNNQGSTITRPNITGFTFGTQPPDTTPPTPTVTTTATDPTRTSPINFAVNFNEAVTGFTATDVLVTNGTVSSFTPVDSRSFSFQVAPTGQGIVSAMIVAGGATDASGNASLASNTASVTFDSTAPGVTVNQQTTNDTTPLITGTVTDPTATVRVTVNNQTLNATVIGNNWSAQVTTGLPDGTFAVTATATDPVGNSNSTTLAGGLVVDATPPTIQFSPSPAQTTNASTVVVTFTFSENVTGFTTDDIGVGNATKGTFQSLNATTYTLEIMPTVDGNVAITIADGAAQDAAGNPSEAANFTILYDTTPPTGTIDPTGNDSITGTATDTSAGVQSVQISIFNGSLYYTGPNTGFDSAQETFLPVATTNSFANWTFAMPFAGTFTVNARITDAATNQATISQSVVVTTAPIATITSTEPNPTGAPTIPVSVSFNEDVTGFDANDLTTAVQNGTASNFQQVDARNYTFDITPTADGMVTFTLAANAVQDANTNGNAETVFTRVSDQTAPVLDIDPTPTAANAITGTATDATTTVASVQVSVFDGTNYLNSAGTAFDSGTEVFLSVTTSDNFATWSLTVPTTGTFDVNAQADDAVGNQATDTQSVTVV